MAASAIIMMIFLLFIFRFYLIRAAYKAAPYRECDEAKKFFVSNVDSSAVYDNSSTRFTDGGEFGLGCEMGISTQKLHARGPMGLRELNTYKYVIYGDGHIR